MIIKSPPQFTNSNLADFKKKISLFKNLKDIVSVFYEGMKQKIMGVATKNRKGKSKLVSIVFFRNTLQISNHFILFPEILHPRQKGFLFVGRKIADLPVEIVLLKGSLCETLIKKERKKSRSTNFIKISAQTLGVQKWQLQWKRIFFLNLKRTNDASWPARTP